MADVHSPEIRKYNMSRIRGKDTKPEEIVRKYLFSHGFRYRKNVRELPGKPDVVLPKYKTVVFVNGCFWHHHNGCRYFKWPESNAEFWRQKISDNEKRDLKNYSRLESLGWNILVVWECDVKEKRLEDALGGLLEMKKI